MKGKRNTVVPIQGRLIKGGTITTRPLPKRTIDHSKPKVRLDGTPDPDCIPCQQKKKSTT